MEIPDAENANSGATKARRRTHGNPFGHLSPTLPETLYSIAFSLFLLFFVIWGASVYWDSGVPPPMAGLLPAAKAAGRGSTFAISLLYLSTLRTTQTALRKLLADNTRMNDFLAAAVPFHDLMPRFHAALGCVAFTLASVHTICHAADYVIMWGTEYWPKTSGFPVRFDGERSTLGLLITGAVLYGAFALLIIVPGIPYFYFRNLSSGDKDSAFARLRSLAKSLVPTHRLFIATHTIGFIIFTILIAIHAQNKGSSHVAIVFWILGLWSIADLLLRYLPAPNATNLSPIEPTLTYSENGKPVGALLTLPRPEGYTFEAGQYALLRASFHPIWPNSHPFSIASSSADPEKISFVIGKAEGWTARLFSALEGSTRPKFTITRPQGAPAQDHGTFDSLLLVGTGVGCTAMTGVFSSLVARDFAKPEKDLKRKGTGASAASFTSNHSNSSHKISSFVPPSIIGVNATLIAFTIQLTGALMLLLASLTPIRSESAALAILALDILICFTVAILGLLRVVWFASVLQAGGWRHSRSELFALLSVDSFILLLAILQLVFDALGIKDITDPASDMPFVYPALSILGFLSTAIGLARIWVYLHLHSPHGWGSPKVVRMVLSSTGHMEAVDRLLSGIGDKSPDSNGLDWGATLRVRGSGTAWKPEDLLHPGIQRTEVRWRSEDWESMIRLLFNRMHTDHLHEDRAVFFGVFYCGNQKSVRDALAEGMERVQEEHFEECERCFGRVMVETF